MGISFHASLSSWGLQLSPGDHFACIPAFPCTSGPDYLSPRDVDPHSCCCPTAQAVSDEGHMAMDAGPPCQPASCLSLASRPDSLVSSSADPPVCLILSSALQPVAHLLLRRTPRLVASCWLNIDIRWQCSIQKPPCLLCSCVCSADPVSESTGLCDSYQGRSNPIGKFPSCGPGGCGAQHTGVHKD